MKLQLLCGAAKRDITPADLTGLFALTGKPYAGIIDRLALRVVWLERGDQKAMLIGFDLDKAPNPSPWLDEISKMTGVPEENIIYFGTHTHSAPLTTVRPREHDDSTPESRAVMNAYEEFVKGLLHEAIREAQDNKRPARMGFAQGESFINVNRNFDSVYTDPDGNAFPIVSEGICWGVPVDHTLSVTECVQEDGTPIAFFVNFPVHCCLMFLNYYDQNRSMGISGDLAGNISALLEKKYAGAVALWSSGAAGDINPALFNGVIYPDPEDGRIIMERFKDWHFTKQLLDMLVGIHYRDVLAVIDRIDSFYECSGIKGAIEWSQTESLVENDPYCIRLHLLRIGDVAFYGIGGELYNSFGCLIKEHASLRKTMIINHEASLINDAGYILDDDALERARKEAPVRHFIPGQDSRSAAGTVAPSLLKHTESLYQKVLSDNDSF